MEGRSWYFGTMRSTGGPRPGTVRPRQPRARETQRRAQMARPTSPRTRPAARRRPSQAQAHKARIVVADSQAIDRGGMVGLLEREPDFEVVGEAASVQEAVDECRALKPDVLLLSLSLAGQERSAAIPAIRAELPRLRIVALSERGESNCLVLNPPSRLRLTTGPMPSCALGTDCLQL